MAPRQETLLPPTASAPKLLSQESNPEMMTMQQQLGSPTVDRSSSFFAPASSSSSSMPAEMTVDQGSKPFNGTELAGGAPAFAADALSKGEMTFRPFRSSTRPGASFDDPALPMAALSAGRPAGLSSASAELPAMHDALNWNTTYVNQSSQLSPTSLSSTQTNPTAASRERRPLPPRPGSGSHANNEASRTNSSHTANAAVDAPASDAGGALPTATAAPAANNNNVADPNGMSMYGSSPTMGTGLGGLLGGAGYNSYGSYGAGAGGGMMGSYYGGAGAGGLLGGMGGYGGAGMMYPPPMMMSPYMSGPLSSLNQFLFGVQSVIFSLGQAVTILSANASAIQQLLDAAMAMFDHAVATWHELKLLEQRKGGTDQEQEEESEEDKKRRRRLKALRYALVTAASYAAYRLVRRALSSATTQRHRIDNHPYASGVPAALSSSSMHAPPLQQQQAPYPYASSSYPQQPYQPPYYSPY